MSWKSLTCVTLFCALLAGQALAVPTIQVAGVQNAGNVDWTVSFTPDPALMAAGEGALGIELSLEFSEPLLDPNLDPEPHFGETINNTPIVNPGINPYAGGDITEGIATYSNVPSQIGGGGNVNAIFAALGSTLFETDVHGLGPFEALKFTTVGSTGTVSWHGVIAQDGDGDLTIVDGMVSVGAGFIPGDYNGSGQVEAGDLNLVLDNWGDTTPPIPAMWTGDQPDGLIEAGELNRVLDNWGNVAPGALAVGSTAVPEPASIASLLGLAGVGALVLRGRRK